MRSGCQAFFPSVESLQTVEVCVKGLSPDEPTLLGWHESYVTNHKLRIALDLDIVKDKVSINSNVLEFGSIPLLFTLALAECNYNVTGCDIAPERYSSVINKTGIDVVKCDIETEKLPFDDNSFDAAVFNELFEHLRINPIFTLSEVYRVMKPDAPLMLSSPNLRSLEGIRNFLFSNKAYSCSGDIYTEYQKLEKLGHMGHVREYTTREVIEFLENIGFFVSEVMYRGRYSSIFAQILIRSFPCLSPFVSYIAIKPV